MCTNPFLRVSMLSVPIHLTSIRCHGFESNLLSCPHEVDDNGACQHNHDVYLHCSEYNIHYTTVNIQCSIVQYNKVQFSTVQYSIVQYNKVQFSTVQYSIVQYSIVQYSIV